MSLRETPVDLSAGDLEGFAHRAYMARLKAEVPRKDTHVLMAGVELLKKYGGAGMIVANSNQVVTIPAWPERVQIFYYGGEGKKHFQLVTVWSGPNGRVRHSVFARELRDDQAKRDLPQEMTNRLLARKAKAEERSRIKQEAA
jgi:hypothetical protein